jgi:hypothetical protein
LVILGLFFTNYIIVQGLAGYPVFFLTRLFPDFVVCKLTQLFTCRSSSERIKAEGLSYSYLFVVVEVVVMDILMDIYGCCAEYFFLKYLVLDK